MTTKDREAASAQHKAKTQKTEPPSAAQQRSAGIPAADVSGSASPYVMRIATVAVLAAIVGQNLRGLIQGDLKHLPIVFFIQLAIWASHAFFLLWRERVASRKSDGPDGWAFRVHLLVHMALLCSAGPMHLLFIPVMLPIAWISLTEGFRKTIPLVGLAFGSQVLFQGLSLLPAMRHVGILQETDLSLLLIRLLLQYALFLVLFGLLGRAQLRYARSEQDNRLLVERLGDKYVQLRKRAGKCRYSMIACDPPMIRQKTPIAN